MANIAGTIMEHAEKIDSLRTATLFDDALEVLIAHPVSIQHYLQGLALVEAGVRAIKLAALEIK